METKKGKKQHSYRCCKCDRRFRSYREISRGAKCPSCIEKLHHEKLLSRHYCLYCGEKLDDLRYDYHPECRKIAHNHKNKIAMQSQRVELQTIKCPKCNISMVKYEYAHVCSICASFYTRGAFYDPNK